MDVGYVWDESKYEAVKQKHGVYFYEVVSAFEDENGFLEEDPAGNEERWMWVGMSITKRILSIIGTDHDLPSYRIITAFDAEEKWVDEYYQQRV